MGVQWVGQKQFEGAILPFFCNGAHGDGGNEEQEDPRGEEEESAHFRHSTFEQVPLSRKDPMEQAAHQQEDRENHRPDDGGEKRAQFLLVQGLHESASKLG